MAFSTTLRNSMSATDGVMGVLSNTNAPRDYPVRYVIEQEVIYVRGGVEASTDWTVQRGADNTTPAAHAAGVTITTATTPGVLVDLWVGPFAPWPLTGVTQVVAGANNAHLYAFQVFRPVTVTNAYLRIGTASGNIDLGIYGPTGTRLGSSGSIACPTAATTVVVPLTAGVSLTPGTVYFAAIAADNVTAAYGGFTGISTPTIPGQNLMAAVATSFPLPATIVVPSGNSVSARIGIWFA